MLADRWNRLGDRDRRALAIGALILVPALLWVGLVNPYLNLLEESRVRLEAQRTLLERELGHIAVADELPSLIGRTVDQLDREADGLIRASGTIAGEAALSESIQAAARRSRVSIREVRGVDPFPEDESASLEPIRLAVQAESDMRGIADFLNRIESDPITMVVRELSIEPVLSDGRRSEDGPSAMEMGALGFSLIVEAHRIDGLEAITSAEVAETLLTGIPR